MPRSSFGNCSLVPFHKRAITSLASIVLSSLICCSLFSSSLVLAKPTTPNGQSQTRGGRPEPGPPAATLPNLDQVRREHPLNAEPPAAQPSVIRARRKSLVPRNGRTVSNVLTEGTANNREPQSPPSEGTRESVAEAGKNSTHPLAKSVRNKHIQRVISHHASKNSSSWFGTLALLAPPPITDSDYVQRWFTYAVARSPNTDELNYWDDMLRAAYAHAQSSMVMATREMGKTLFESAEYALRARSDHDYIYDLYKTYLMRSPDTGGWSYWEGQVPSLGRENVRRAFDESAEYIADVGTMTTTGNASPAVTSLLAARVDLNNQNGNQLLARDAEWSLTLLSLPGRGLDLGLGISYSSAAVWTRSGPYIYFDDDNSSLSPGFTLGFPTVQEQF